MLPPVLPPPPPPPLAPPLTPPLSPPPPPLHEHKVRDKANEIRKRNDHLGLDQRLMIPSFLIIAKAVIEMNLADPACFENRRLGYLLRAQSCTCEALLVHQLQREKFSIRIASVSFPWGHLNLYKSKSLQEIIRTSWRLLTGIIWKSHLLISHPRRLDVSFSRVYPAREG